MAERFKAHDWKACKRRKLLRGFKSLSLRHLESVIFSIGTFRLIYSIVFIRISMTPEVTNANTTEEVFGKLFTIINQLEPNLVIRAQKDATIGLALEN